MPITIFSSKIDPPTRTYGRGKSMTLTKSAIFSTMERNGYTIIGSVFTAIPPWDKEARPGTPPQRTAGLRLYLSLPSLWGKLQDPPNSHDPDAIASNEPKDNLEYYYDQALDKYRALLNNWRPPPLGPDSPMFPSPPLYS